MRKDALLRTNHGTTQTSKGTLIRVKYRHQNEIHPQDIWSRKGAGYNVTIINVYDTAIHYQHNGRDNAMYREDFYENYRFYMNPVSGERYYR